MTTLRFRSRVWKYEGPAAWYFVTLPNGVGRRLKAEAPRRPGFGSLRVLATIQGVTWPTSLFPDRKSGSYLLPIKAPVRKRADIAEGDVVTVSLVFV